MQPQPAPPLRYVAASDIAAALPPLAEQLVLAERTLRALGTDAELPPKIGVHPRQAASLAHAMPALLRGTDPSGVDDLLGLKWIAGFPDNPGLGLPAYHALVLLNDPRTGVPVGILDGGPITAARTAAISGVAIREFVRPGIRRVALLGAGVQAASHLPVVGLVVPGAEVRIFDLAADRARALADRAGSIEGIGRATVAADATAAVRDAELVVSVTSFGPNRQALDRALLRPDVLFVAVDYDMQASAALAREAFFAIDERGQFLATRSGAVFAGYPDPDATLGELLRREVAGPAGGPVLVAHLGVGLADVVFASAILERAAQLGLGLVLPG